MPSIGLVLRQHVAALRMLVVLTVILGVAYPLVVTLIGHVPGLAHQANGSTITSNGQVVGSSLIGQSFTDSDGKPLVQYFQTRPSAAGDGYDPTASSASNLGPESIVDTLPDPKAPKDSDEAAGKPSLLTQVCSRSLAIGQLEGVSGARPFCTPDGVGAVLGVFYGEPNYRGPITRVVSLNQPCPVPPFLESYRGVRVECATPNTDYSAGKVVPIRGDAPAKPAVPSDAVTASGSGLDPAISPAYARLQEERVAKARGIGVAEMAALVDKYQTGRALGFMGEPAVNVVELNRALDAKYPYRK
ncbi:MAG TPA: potassium-transporting ATPase subunit C [Jatrophihabitantaceae bacterium]|nr:potassium-transporting ATPase subunit C [Jatrophihabitantaceae bacterium]